MQRYQRIPQNQKLEQTLKGLAPLKYNAIQKDNENSFDELPKNPQIKDFP